MNAGPNDREISPLLAHDERWAMVLRVVSSAHFVKAPQIRDILVYLTRRALEDSATSISEHEVGRNVLGRRPDFSPNEDNIVRVQVRHLRKKLEDYFITEGRDEAIVLTIPKGSYVPSFQPRPDPPPAPILMGTSVPGSRWIEHSDATRPRNRLVIGGVIGLICLCAVLAIVAIRFWNENAALRARIPNLKDRIPAADDVLWSKIFAPGQNATIVVADSCLVMVQDILKIDAPLRDLVGTAATSKFIDGVKDQPLRAALELISKRQYTTLGDLNVSADLFNLSRQYNARPRLRYARYLDTREFKSGNFVIIGSHRGVPWVQLFEPQLNFHLEQDPKSQAFGFRNRTPQAGEPSFYGGNADGKNQDVSFADIAILPNLSGSGLVVIISGITMEATEAAGEFVTGKDFSAALAQLMRERPADSHMPSGEVFLQATTMPGTASGARIICHRWLAQQKAQH